MDRFIDGQDLILTIKYVHLKSNMDRFIGHAHASCPTAFFYLKSNMDRFIAAKEVREA